MSAWVRCLRHGGGAQRCEQGHHVDCSERAEWIEDDHKHRTIRQVATVTVSSPVDGTNRRRSAGPRQQRATPVEGYTVDPRLIATLRAALRPGERLVIRGGVVRTEYR